MKKEICIVFALTIAFFISSISTAMGEDIEISGFFDFDGSYHKSTADETSFGLGQAELDLKHQLNDKIVAAVAIAYNNETNHFKLGAATMEMQLYKNEKNAVISFSIVAGQFDVPFGIDYKVYASIDRKLISPPLAIDLTHQDWNDYGIQFSMDWQYGNIVAYAVNGFESSYVVSDAAHALTLSASVGDEINTTPANAFGTRAGLTPIEHLEIGSSVAIGLNQSNKGEMLMIGTDFQYEISHFNFKGEYIYHSVNRSIEEENNKGYYIQALYNINQVFLTSRYGAFRPDGESWIDRYTFGAGYIVADGVEVRFETTINENSNDNTNIVQLMGSF